MRFMAMPTVERDRFFPGPTHRGRAAFDAHSAAIERLCRSCDRMRPHLESAAALRLFIHRQPNPRRVCKRISLVLAMDNPYADFAYGFLGEAEIEAFRGLARRHPAAVTWVFS
jgi:hypothetical protein